MAQGIAGVHQVDAQPLRVHQAETSSTREGEHALRGTITAIDQRTGLLSLRTDAGVLTLAFPPSSVTGLREGDTLTVYLAFAHDGPRRR